MKNDRVIYAGMEVKLSDYNKKALEIALPDVIISESIKKELDDFQKTVLKKELKLFIK